MSPTVITGPQRASPHKIEAWLRQLACDHDGVALIVGKAVASILIDAPRGRWIALGHICEITNLPSNTIAGVLYRLCQRGRISFERCGREAGATFRFTIPTEVAAIVERERVWSPRPDPITVPENVQITKCPPGKPPRTQRWSKGRAKWAVRRASGHNTLRRT
jgi:hypothetical protein